MDKQGSKHWEVLNIKRATFYKYKNEGMPADLEQAKQWMQERQAFAKGGSQIVVGGKTFTASDLLDLRGQVMEQQKINLELKNQIEKLNLDERTGRLVDADQQAEALARLIVPLRKALDALPENIAKAQNPDDPARAEEILRQELENIYADLVANMEKQK